METLTDKIEVFLRPGDGSGSGSGSGDVSGDVSGSGYGDGYGDVSGSGSGSGSGYGSVSGSVYGSGSVSGYGYGDVSGSGYGSGDGDGIKVYQGQPVYRIDNIPTLIDSVHETYAKGFILNSDLTLKPCYIARVGNSFAHGESLHQAHADAAAKELKELPVDKRIEKFWEAHCDTSKKYPARDLFDWHGILTGSCTMGRKQFCIEHNIDLDSDKFTVQQFIKLTCKAYGGHIILQL